MYSVVIKDELESKPNKQNIPKSQEKKKQFENISFEYFHISLKPI